MSANSVPRGRDAGPGDIEATVQFLPAEAGGREGPTPRGSLACILVVDDRNFDCRLILPPGETLRPGQSGIFPIKFLDPDSVRKVLQAGMRFTLRDYRTIANGRVKSVCWQ